MISQEPRGTRDVPLNCDRTQGPLDMSAATKCQEGSRMNGRKVRVCQHRGYNVNPLSHDGLFG